MADIAILIPHYNNYYGLKKSLASITNFEPVDAIIVDDGSIQKPELSELKRLYKQFNDIFIVLLSENKGIEHALNEGLRFIISKNSYKYIARLDCGDTCHPKRFYIQKLFLEQNPEICLVGSWVSFIDLEGKECFTVRPPLKHRQIIKKMFLNNVFIHPSIMLRIDVINHIGNYPINYKYAEDYAYFFKIVKRYQTANINEILVQCESNPQGISESKRRIQLHSRLRIIIENFKWSYYPIVGLIRNLIIYCLPYSLIKRMKRAISR